ncbi:short-chain oxidoreductase [Arthroderma uncinatum]|uniref:short-chain oxidoreductase n=1 Tax=Arthroderma uncinatum TaxID=74035 RepID=UPI00144AC40B|nr:short-chain oxidoreductase [Arthroderma uncinatum]KAF3479450.1 short-chain oxidoreductase [Arthroderma uncinatum]
MAPRVWFITGCSSGFGWELTLEALRRGDKVIATARKPEKIEKLKEAGADIFGLDVTSSLDDIRRLVWEAHNIHGHIDILVNNAGYIQQGALEEVSPEETYALFNTNVFGPLNVIRAVLPYMRSQHSGVIANTSSAGSWTNMAGGGLYSATKSALSGATETLRVELEPFGISVTSLEPGDFRSNLLAAGHRFAALYPIPDYDNTPTRAAIEESNSLDHKQPGDLVKGSKIIVDVLTQTGCAAGRRIPVRVALGAEACDVLKDKCKDTLALLEEWKDIVSDTNHDDVQPTPRTQSPDPART